MSDVSCELETNLFCGGCCVDVRLALYEAEASQLKKVRSVLTAVLEPWGDLKVSGIEPGSEEVFCWSGYRGQEIITTWVEEAREEEERDYWLNIREHARGLKPGQGLYEMDGQCGYLQTNGSCGNYDDRPQVCSDFPTGSEACVRLRTRSNIEVPVAIGRLASPPPFQRGC